LVVGASFSEMITIEGTQGWAQKYMSLRRFKAIRRAFPEEKIAGAAGGKCYQLRYAINQRNAASQATFIPGPTLSFDEGGVPMRSRLCPVRQYNKDTDELSRSLLQRETREENRDLSK